MVIFELNREFFEWIFVWIFQRQLEETEKRQRGQGLDNILRAREEILKDDLGGEFCRGVFRPL